ncbi:putative hemolysin [Enterobacter sp. UPMP2052]
MIAASVILVAGCTSSQKQEKPVGMANPASVHCIKQGGRLDIVKESGGEVGYCTLSSGERIDEWTLFRCDNSK